MLKMHLPLKINRLILPMLKNDMALYFSKVSVDILEDAR